MLNQPTNQMLLWLKQYIETTPAEQVAADWKQVKDMGFSGPNAFEYLQYSGKWHLPHTGEVCKTVEIINPDNLTPNFSGSFFLCNIAL